MAGYPIHKDAQAALDRAEVTERLQSANRSFQQGKAEEDLLQRTECFQAALRGYELSVPAVGGEDLAKLRKNLMNTQLRLAQCAAESSKPSAAKLVRHHLDQAVQQARSRNRLLGDEGSEESLVTVWLKIDLEPAAIPFDIRMLAYRYLKNTSAAALSTLALRAASCLVKKAVIMTAGSSYDEALVAASNGRLSSDPTPRLAFTGGLPMAGHSWRNHCTG